MKRCNNCFETCEIDFNFCPNCRYKEGNEAAQPFYLTPGTILNERYIVGQVLGFGGFGITYMAWDKTLDTVMAIKEYYPSGLVNRIPRTKNVILFSGNRRKEYNHGLMRFLDEARSMARFSSHKYIINVFEYFEENSTAYIVMEYLEGTTLGFFLKNNKMDMDTCIEVVGYVCQALKDVHKVGIVHRDVSPDNIFLCTNNRIKLIDFGASRFGSEEEQQRTVILKPGFAPPEQYEKVNIQGPWTDIYALGATFYYMVMGEKPEESTNRKVSDTLVPPHEADRSIPEYIGNTIMQAMAIDRHIRFSQISDFEKALNREKKVLPVKKQIKNRKLRRLTGLASAFLVVVLSAFILYTVINRQRDEETLPETTISIAFSLSGNAESDAAREAAFSSIIEAFRAGFPNVTVEMRTYADEFALLDAIRNENPPTLFESTRLGEGAMVSATNLHGVVNQLEGDMVHFLDDYDVHFPEGNRLPLAFNAPVLFINTTLTDFVGTGLNTYSVSGFELYTDRASFISGDIEAYFSDTSAFPEIQQALPGRYRLVYIDTPTPEAQFAELWSMSAYAGANERRASERFLLFLLSDTAQDILHIRNRSGNLPINRNVLEVFSYVHDDFYGFFGNIELYVF